MIAILDFGSAGNIASVANALRRAGAECRITPSLGSLQGISGLVIPGVGSFAAVPDLVSALGKQRIGVPVLCICLGMQALFSRSEECKGARGLGIIPGNVRRLKGNVRLPQLGWNRINIEKQDPLFTEIADGEYFYFANSFAAFPKDDGATLCSTQYGQRFASAVREGNFWGVQFHPEKSGKAGQMLIRNFISICSGQGSSSVPSIDIMDGKAVRLLQGKRGTEKVFGNPLALARKYEKAGFRLAHIVDMDAVFGGKSQLALLRKIASACPRLRIQWAGGMRSFEAAKKALACGASKVVFGTALASSPKLVQKCSEEFGSNRVWVSLDFSGKPARMMVKGWKKGTSLGLKEAVKLAEKCKVGGLVIGSVDVDGMQAGPALALLSKARNLTRLPIVLAGGMRNPDDVKDAVLLGANGAMLGRALYDRRIGMEEWTC